MAKKKEVRPIKNAQQKGSFVKHVLQDLKALEELYKRNFFEKDNIHIGAELELNVLDDINHPSFEGYNIYKELDAERLTTEYARFNLEINSDPIPFSGNGLSALKKNLDKPLGEIRKEAQRRNLKILLTGIIPTLTKRHISRDALTPQQRFEVLYDIRKDLHGENYEYNIRGIDEVIIHDNVLLFAGCLTSFQMHMQVAPDQIVEKYNWAQMIAGPLLSAANSSPLFLGKKLWRETRIALFEQSTDTRKRTSDLLDRQARVTFGNKWVDESVMEIFQEDLATYEPLFTNDLNEDPFVKIEQGITPNLDAWTLFNGSVYRWNRICYGITDEKPSLRIENRLLPAGPTMEDMIANMAFWAGLMNGMPEKYTSLQDKMLFDEVKQNFLKAAHLGLDVQFKWLNDEMISAQDLILKELLPIAEEGLKKAKIDTQETAHYLDIIRERVSSRKTGSQWILESFNNLSEEHKQEDALSALTSGMMERQKTEQPVHTWVAAKPGENKSVKKRFNQVHKVMTASPVKIKEDTVVDLAAHILEWKKIGHILVENEETELVGVLNKNAIINFLMKERDKEETTTVREIMISDPITVEPDTSVEEAIHIILENDLSCLPVVKDKRAVGIVTKHDFVTISKFFISEK